MVPRESSLPWSALEASPLNIEAWRISLAKPRMALRFVGSVAVATGVTVACMVCTGLGDQVRSCCLWLADEVIARWLIRPPEWPAAIPEPVYSGEDDDQARALFKKRHEEWVHLTVRAKADYFVAREEHKAHVQSVGHTLQLVGMAFAPAFASGVLMYLLMLRLMKRRRAIDGHTRCGNCGYILKGLEEPRCSECGTAI